MGYAFYDQSHMIQEFRSLTGVPPVELHRARRLEALDDCFRPLYSPRKV